MTVPQETSHRGRPVVLALGGGGARGLVHIGVLRAIEERGYAVEAISGCSMGGVIGAMVCSGHRAKDITDVIERTDFHKLLDFGIMGGLFGCKKIAGFLSDHLPERFEDLAIPLRVTAVDVQRGTLVVLGKGPLVPALLASSALPGILSPVELGDRVLVDGGVLNNLPIDIARTMSLAPVLAVDVGAPHDRELDFARDHGLVATIKRFTKRRFRTLNLELFMKSFDIPQRFITETRLAMDPPDVLIRPSLDVNFGIEEIHRLEEAIELGYDATQVAIERWEQEHPGDG